MNHFLEAFERYSRSADQPAVLSEGIACTYEKLQTLVEQWQKRFQDWGYAAGHVIAFQGDYSPTSISLLLASIQTSQLVVPLASGIRGELQELLRISGAEVLVRIEPDEGWSKEELCPAEKSALAARLIASGDPGLVLFSSGSTGTPKASLHNFTRFLSKFNREGPALRTIAVPPMDHVSGLDTLFYCLSRGGTLVCPSSRNPEELCRAIECHRAELLPASATFLNLLLASRAYERYDLSSLRIIAFGSDVMPEATLRRLRELLPNTTLLQKYGTTEFGSPSTKSREDGSLWLRIADQGFETKILDGILWVRSQSAMLGYLNAPNPFDDHGWLNTGDVVEESEDGYVRILGRKSDVINVGGNKVFPAEVETVLLELNNVEDVVVYGRNNPLMGKVVAARVQLKAPEEISSLKSRMREFCRKRLAPHKIPVFIDTVEDDLMNVRHKKIRREAVLTNHV